jgi:hypothetical protein
MPNQKNPEVETSPMQTEPTGILEVRAKEFISSKNPLQRGSNCKAVLVAPDDVPYIWDRILPYIELSQTDEKELSPDDFLDSLVGGEMQLWVVVEDKEIIACMISRFANYPQKKVLRIVFVGGEGMEKWLEFLPLIEDFALMNGCTFMEVWGRKAWLRILKDWKCTYHIITKDLTSRMH